MAGTLKLSQITPANPVAPTDQLVGVIGGSTDALYTLGLIGLTPATSNLTFYVATTGSDSNPGTSAKPFATLQHAWNVATSFNYQDLYTFTIQINNGTYTISGNILSAPLSSTLNINGTPSIVGNHSSPSSVVLDCTASLGGGISFTGFPTAVLSVDGIQINSGGTGLGSFGGTILIGSIAFGGSIMGIALEANGGSLFALHGNIDLTRLSTNILSQVIFCSGLPSAGATFKATTFVFSANYTIAGQFALATTFGFMNFQSNTYINGGSLTAEGANLSDFSILSTDNGLASDLPGSGGIVSDFTSLINSNNSGLFGTPFVPISGAPTTSDLISNTGGLFYDTVGHVPYVAFYDPNTASIKKVALT